MTFARVIVFYLCIIAAFLWTLWSHRHQEDRKPTSMCRDGSYSYSANRSAHVFTMTELLSGTRAKTLLASERPDITTKQRSRARTARLIRFPKTNFSEAKKRFDSPHHINPGRSQTPPPATEPPELDPYTSASITVPRLFSADWTLDPLAEAPGRLATETVYSPLLSSTLPEYVLPFTVVE
jgi:hypothetical protein